MLGELFRTKDDVLLGYRVYSAFGLVLGYKMQVSFPRSVESGGPWIWVPSVCLAIFWILHDSSVFRRSMLPDYLWPAAGPDLKG